jgi:hypothetical protein
MRKIFLQIGYPKSFSSSLQRSFFKIHPEIGYGGIGRKNAPDNISYANADIEYLFECLLKYVNYFSFLEKKEYAKTVLKQFIDQVSENKTIVFSSEHLIFPFTPQHVDFPEIIRRIQQLFEGYKVHFIIILRRQDALIKSLYGEYIKVGYPETYSEFIKWIWGYRNRNFWKVLQYDTIFKFLSRSLPKENIHIQFFERLKQNPRQIINENFSEMLGISNRNLSINNDNPSLGLGELKALLALNKKDRRGMGNHILFPFENHRNRESLKRLDSNYTNDEIFVNVYAKRIALVKAKQSLQKEDIDLYKLSPVVQDIYEKMKQSWRESNFNLMEIGIELPDEYYSIK